MPRPSRLSGALVGAALLVALLPSGPAGAVIGGEPTDVEAHPYYVDVGTAFEDGCSGSLIAERWVLTAAHCVDELQGVWVGVRGAGRVAADRVVIHPQWTGESSGGHDLALLHLGGLGETDQAPIVLGAPYRASYYEPGQQVTLVARGQTDPAVEGRSPTPMQVEMAVRSDTRMELLYDWPFGNRYHPALMLGAGAAGANGCVGDSGGPLSVQRGGQRVQIGVVSYGRDSCDWPGVYTEMDDANLAWVATVVPSVVDGWSTCLAGGRVGRPLVSYEWRGDGPYRDGNYTWDLTCVTDLPPPPRPPVEEPPICLIKPTKCPMR